MNRSDALNTFNDALVKAKESHARCNDVVTFLESDNELVTKALENSDGSLYGLPIALKDNVNTKGIKTSACCNILNNYIPQYNATIVDKLVNAGALIVCKSSMDELAMGGTNLTSNIGPCLNPYDTNRISGGSSGGSAALVGSGALAMAIGTDTGDSIRKPAAYCGCVGVKPTYGRISRYGIIPYSSSLDHVGVFANSVKLAAQSISALSGRDDHDLTSGNQPVEDYVANLNASVKGKTIGVIGNVIDSIDNADILEQFNGLCNALEAQGATIKKVYYDEQLIKTILPTYYIIANCEASANHSNLDGIRFGVQKDGDTPSDIMMNSRTQGLGKLIRKRFVIGSYGLFEENQDKLFRKAQKIRRLLVEATEKMYEEVDALFAPAAPSIAPLLNDENADQLSDKYLIADNWLILGNFMGAPSMTIPLGLSQGCPIATNIMCKPWNEQLMFDMGSVIEQCSQFEVKKGEN